MFHNTFSNIVLKVLISDTPSTKEVEHLENKCNIIKLVMHSSICRSLLKTMFECRKALMIEWVEGNTLSELIKHHNFVLKDFGNCTRNS